MSDPLSATSSVIGVVSLGLVVCQGLVTYFSTYKGQNQYLDSLTQRTENLQGCLTLLQHALPLWMVRFSDTASHIEQHITACQASIVVLSSKLSGFKRTQGPSLHRDKLRYVAHKAAFPFTKATITELSGILDGLQENLNTILCIVGLEASSILVKTQDVTNTKIDAVLSASGVMTARIQSASDGLSSLRAEMSTIQNDLQAVKSILGTGVPALIRRTDGPSLNARPQNWQQRGLEIRQVEAQHLPTPVSPTGTSLHASPGRPSCSTPNTLKWSNSYVCLCPRTKTRRPARAKLLFIGYLQTQEHEEDCPYYLPGAKRRALDIWISYRSVLISRGVRCMVSLATGSAGRSISANIDWIPVVSSKTSPAIQLLVDLRLTLDVSAEPNALLDNARVELMGLFTQRKAHPREVNEDGRSLLWYASKLALTSYFVFYGKDAAFQSFCRLLYSLASWGAKENLADIIDRFTLVMGGRPELGLLTEDLSQRGALEVLSDKSKLAWVYSLVYWPQWYHVLQTGPLSKAILRRTPKEAIRLLQHKPSLISELNDWGHSLVHLSSDWPLGLVILLKHGASSLINVNDKSGAKPMEWTLSTSNIATMILIAAGSGLDNNALDIVMWKVNREISQELSDVAAEGLGCRRKQLQRLAASHLPQHRLSFSAETLKVLDEQAAGVSTALDESGIRIPGALSTSRHQTTIYHSRRVRAGTAQKFFNNGFQDIDGRNHQGYTPLMVGDWWDGGPPDLQYAQWLCDRGASLLCQFPTCTNNNCWNTDEHQRPPALRATHIVAFQLGLRLFEFQWNVLDFLNSTFPTDCFELLSTIVSSNLSDGCSCACSSQGCIPILNFLSNPSPVGGPRSYWFLRWLDLYFPYDFPQLFLKVLRLYTFEGLGLTHTCCRHGCRRDCFDVYDPREKVCPFSIPIDDEIQEIQNEETHLIALLDSLMAEFTEQWLWPTSDWKVDEFMSKIWRPRLRQIRQERAQMFVGDQEQMRCMGVELHSDDEDSLTEDGDEGDRYATRDPNTNVEYYWDGQPPPDAAFTNAARKTKSKNDLREIRAFFTNAEVAEILKGAARENGLEDYDIWFSIIEKFDGQQNEELRKITGNARKRRWRGMSLSERAAESPIWSSKEDWKCFKVDQELANVLMFNLMRTVGVLGIWTLSSHDFR
ncbi:putative galactinol--sucrose galactosyltransferase 6 [Fonsecaea nubica]|uniref:Putative galactinol--sucrose galactosyltransferase 6 n=1 Tax=Fonsecaea nubica TaxID=856822 RepID=A0A178DF92_9EURO|nr:putative galactinol--sucrose galactosyltransferase 6 [Fonsecaea nubica]OAL40004.1 putative galactinol--sucrose galactosyltransferase 6 [Fonsecaea nubica]